MISLNCLWAKSNNRTRGQFECDVTWYCFCFDFVRLHARYLLVREGERGGVRLKLNVPGQGDGRICDADGQGVRVLKIGQFSWAPYVYHPLGLETLKR